MDAGWFMNNFVWRTIEEPLLLGVIWTWRTIRWVYQVIGYLWVYRENRRT